ncbi:MAG: TldD/PmbA family protein, partial [Candidatus Thorarchaeota archaeon]
SSKKIQSIGNLYDSNVDEIQMEEVIDITKVLLSSIREADSRLTVDSAGVEARSEVRSIVSSKGMDFEEKNTSMTWGIFGWAVDGEDIGTFQGENDSVVALKELNHVDGAASFSTKAINSLNARKTEAFKGCALFSPEAVQDLLDIVLLAALGATIQGGNSYLQDKIGEAIAHKSLTIAEDGTIPNSVSSKSFDREGVPPKPMQIVDSGVFKEVLHNAFTANKAGLESTGHAYGTYRTAPNTQPTNIEVFGGTKSLDDMISEIDSGIYVQRISAMPDPASGDFSAVVKGGKLIEKGELTDTLKELTCSGNVFEGIKNISSISKDRKQFRSPGDSQFSYRASSWLVPYIRIENLDFAS